ncbi:hypothetical protein [Campylobacter gastrosuis]|uniref:Uncharacterized protein n=1 Tax=Campylobacter gastrosuis TaxID=2974576 RepID=A0ABT7HT73_9BACT|nr:hypothetical protein [Campylobacter gastrosuis]MDL0090066.1 hypothetical protein [Campylobacter gastrosuis]
MSFYKTKDGDFSKEGVFVGFLKNVNAKASNSGDTKIQNATLSYALSLQNEFKAKVSNINLEKVAQDEILIQELLRQKSKNQTSTALQNNDKAEAKKLMERINALMSQTAV